MFENPRRGRQARDFTTNVSKILDLKSSCEQIFFRKLSLGAPEIRYSMSRVIETVAAKTTFNYFNCVSNLRKTNLKQGHTYKSIHQPWPVSHVCAQPYPSATDSCFALIGAHQLGIAVGLIVEGFDASRTENTTL